MDKRQLAAAVLGASLLTAALPSLSLAQDEVQTFAAEDVQWLLASYVDGEVVNDVAEGLEVSLLLPE